MMGLESEDLVLWTFALLRIVLDVQTFILAYSFSFSQSLACAGAAAATSIF
jgi:hypothetical protein